ncbi:MAG: hypothetical protein AAF340_07795 [Pseudomonadota bacterium]
MTPTEINKYRHRKETSRFYLTLFVIAPFLGFLVLLIFLAGRGGFIGVAIFLTSFFVIRWFLHHLAMANVKNNMVAVTEKSFPEVHGAIQEAQRFFSYPSPIEAFVFEEGSYHMLLAPLMRTKVLLLHSEIIDPDAGENKEMRYLVGRFVGAMAARHYRFMTLEMIVDGFEKIAVFNILLYPYQRATQLTGDRLGYAFIGNDIQTSVRTLLRLSAGRNVAHRVNVNSFLEQGRSSAGFFSFVTRMLSKFPHMTERVNSLVSFSRR